jgi:hypothetical protein
MAGRPKLRALTERLSDPSEEDTLWENIANGSTFGKEASRLNVTRAALYEWVNGAEERKERLAYARQCQALGHVEDAGELLETADNDNWKVRKEIASHKRWTAERLDRPTWGTNNGPQVTLNVGDLHLTLLKSLPSLTPLPTQPIDVPLLSGEVLTDTASLDGQASGDLTHGVDM